MRTMRTRRIGRTARVAALATAAALQGCGVVPFLPEGGSGGGGGGGGAPMETGASIGLEPGQPGAAGGVVPPPEARTVEEYDTTSAAERAEAAAPAESGDGTLLGTTVASLGAAADPGFWAETPLVTSVREGRLVYPETGRSVRVELRPSGGAPGSGTRVSLPALRLLDAPLTALPELEVFGL